MAKVAGEQHRGCIDKWSIARQGAPRHCAFAAVGVIRYHPALTREFNGSGRPMSHARISINPAVMMGKPCIKGTRITVELILRKLGAGRSFADLLEAYPKLMEDDLRAALAFAADYMQHETVLAAE
jgi:uncharacterized protein (DUF433 family)